MDAAVEERRGEEFREALTMGLYVSLSLQTVALATPTPDVGEDRAGVALTLFLTAVGLLLAHQVAFRLSTKLTNRGVVDVGSVALLRAQTLGGLPVAFIASVPVLFLGEIGLTVAELTLLAFVGVVGFLAARSGGASRTHALVYVIGLVVVIAAILALKIAVNH